MISLALAEDLTTHHVTEPSSALLLSSLNFLILVTVLYFLLKKPIRDFFNTRATQVRTAIDESHKAYQTIRAQNDKLVTRMKGLEMEKQKMIESFRREGEDERKKIVTHAKEMVEEMKGDAAKIAANEVKRACEELRHVTTLLARDMAKNFLDKDLSEDDETRLNQSFINRFEKLN